MVKRYTTDAVIDELRKEVEATSYRKTAKRIGQDHAYLHKVLSGAKEVTQTLAAAYGFEFNKDLSKIA